MQTLTISKHEIPNKRKVVILDISKEGNWEAGGQAKTNFLLRKVGDRGQREKAQAHKSTMTWDAQGKRKQCRKNPS